MPDPTAIPDAGSGTQGDPDGTAHVGVGGGGLGALHHTVPATPSRTTAVAVAGEAAAHYTPTYALQVESFGLDPYNAQATPFVDGDGAIDSEVGCSSRAEY